MSFTYYFLILAGAALLMAGCSASSGANRYQTQNDPEEKKEVRFTSEDNLPDQQPIADADTSEYLDEYSAQDEDEFPEYEEAVDIAEVLKKFNTSPGSSSVLDADNSSMKEKMLMEIIEYLNTPYKYGGNSKKGIDCSAFTQTVFYNVLSAPLLRSAREQFTQGLVIDDRENLLFGDLVFFNTRRRVRPGHVGIYIGDNLFAHASSKQGVIISSLDHEYYSKRFMGGRRIEDVYTQLSN